MRLSFKGAKGAEEKVQARTGNVLWAYREQASRTFQDRATAQPHPHGSQVFRVPTRSGTWIYTGRQTPYLPGFILAHAIQFTYPLHLFKWKKKRKKKK